MTRNKQRLGTVRRLIAVAVLTAFVALLGFGAAPATADIVISFRFTNTTHVAVNDIHVGFSGGRVYDHPNVNCNPPVTSTTYSHHHHRVNMNFAPISPSGSLTCHFSVQSGAPVIHGWYWTVNGTRVGIVHQGCTSPSCEPVS